MNNLKKGQYIVRWGSYKIEVFDCIMKAKAKIVNLMFAELWAELHEITGSEERVHGLRYDTRAIVLYGNGCGDEYTPYHFELEYGVGR